MLEKCFCADPGKDIIYVGVMAHIFSSHVSVQTLHQGVAAAARVTHLQKVANWEQMFARLSIMDKTKVDDGTAERCVVIVCSNSTYHEPESMILSLVGKSKVIVGFAERCVVKVRNESNNRHVSTTLVTDGYD